MEGPVRRYFGGGKALPVKDIGTIFSRNAWRSFGFERIFSNFIRFPDGSFAGKTAEKLVCLSEYLAGAAKIETGLGLKMGMQ